MKPRSISYDTLVFYPYGIRPKKLKTKKPKTKKLKTKT